MLGDRSQGIYNLRISNASLEDDAEYQCQVGPAKFNSAIRANAKLTVICKYSSTILFPLIIQLYNLQVFRDERGMHTVYLCFVRQHSIRLFELRNFTKIGAL